MPDFFLVSGECQIWSIGVRDGRKMRPFLKYGLVRMCRGAVLGSSVGLATDNAASSFTGIAISEVVSVATDVVRILPMLGDLFWLVMLFPVVAHTYKDVCLYPMQTRYQKEMEIIIPFVMGMLVATLGVGSWEEM